MHNDTPAHRESLNRSELGEHLGVSCSKTVAGIVARIGLEPVAGVYPWRRVFRHVHGTEGHLLAGHLEELKSTYGTPAFEEIEDAGARAAARDEAQGSPIIDALEDLETALKEPLWSFEQMAAALGKRADTLAKALRQGRMVLPFPTLQLGPRLRLYRPLEVRLWCEECIALDLPPARRIAASAPPAAAAAESSTLPAETAQKAVFGQFARPKRNAAA